MKQELRIKYLKILQDQYLKGIISGKKYKKEIKFVRSLKPIKSI